MFARGTNISYTQERGDKQFHTGERGTNIFIFSGGGQTFYFEGHDDVNVDEEIYVSKANFLVSEAHILVSEASKLSAGARIFRGP